MRPPPKKGTGRELVEVAVEAGLNAVPVAGGPAAVAFAYAVGRAFERRMSAWLTELAESVDELVAQVENVSIEQLVNNADFIDAVVTATRVAQRTHRQDKLTALRNAILNSALPGAPDTDIQTVFFRWIDEFAVGHLQLLTLLNSPTDWYAKRGLAIREDMIAGSRRQMIDVGIPKFAGRKEFVDVLVRDLASAGLINAGIDGMVSGRGVYNQLTTGLGEQFIAFITDPRR